jgi:hypothetical protein
VKIVKKSKEFLFFAAQREGIAQSRQWEPVLPTNNTKDGG